MSFKVHGLFLKIIGDSGMSRLFSCLFVTYMVFLWRVRLPYRCFNVWKLSYFLTKILFHVLSVCEAVHEKLKEQIKDVDAAQSKEVSLFWCGMAEVNVQSHTFVIHFSHIGVLKYDEMGLFITKEKAWRIIRTLRRLFIIITSGLIRSFKS